MTAIERTPSRRVTPLTLLGVLLLPAIIGGILVTALYNPSGRLDAMSAAIVNLDEPVTVEGQYLPLGRQLAAGLVEGSEDLESNLSWVISNEADAARGLADGTYHAIVTIPQGFSAAATSPGRALGGEAVAPQQAEISVLTPADGLLADALITSQIAQAAATTMGSVLSETTLENVLIGFATIGEQLGTAADGALQLADGAADAAEGAAVIPGGADQLAEGAKQLGAGAGELGAGLKTIAQKTREAAAGAQTLGSGLRSGADRLLAEGIVPAELRQAAQGAAGASAGVSDGVNGLAQELTALAAACPPEAGESFCAQLAGMATSADQLTGPAGQAAQAAGGTSAGLDQLAASAPQALAAQLREAADAAAQLGSGLGQLATGVDQSAAGARSLDSGASRLSAGATDLATGSGELVAGLEQLAQGADELARGLASATAALPSFDEEESTSLAAVIADPVASGTGTTSLFGASAIPLLATVVLWFGALASFVPLRAMTGRALTSRRPSAWLAGNALWPAAAIGAGQGVLVAIIVQIVARYDAAAWWGFAGMAVLAALAFTAANQALVAVLGGAGRWVSGLVGTLALATGIISTVPGWLVDLAGILPTAPAFAGLVAPASAAVVALLVWAALSFAATTLAIAARRTTSARAVLQGA